MTKSTQRTLTDDQKIESASARVQLLKTKGSSKGELLSERERGLKSDTRVLVRENDDLRREKEVRMREKEGTTEGEGGLD